MLYILVEVRHQTLELLSFYADWERAYIPRIKISKFFGEKKKDNEVFRGVCFLTIILCKTFFTHSLPGIKRSLLCGTRKTHDLPTSKIPLLRKAPVYK